MACKCKFKSQNDAILAEQDQDSEKIEIALCQNLAGQDPEKIEIWIKTCTLFFYFILSRQTTFKYIVIMSIKASNQLLKFMALGLLVLVLWWGSINCNITIHKSQIFPYNEYLAGKLSEL